MVVSFETNTEGGIYCSSFSNKRHSSDPIYVERIQDIIENYRDKIEIKFNADFVRVDKLLTSSVFIYKIKSGHYIYDTGKLLFEMENHYAKINKNYKYFITQNEDKIYIKIKDIKEFIELYKIENLNIQENVEEEMLKPILIDNKLISENKYNLRTKESSKINVLLDEISKRELDKDNPIIYNYYLPELIEFEQSYNLLDEEG